MLEGQVLGGRVLGGRVLRDRVGVFLGSQNSKCQDLPKFQLGGGVFLD